MSVYDILGVDSMLTRTLEKASEKRAKKLKDLTDTFVANLQRTGEVVVPPRRKHRAKK